MPAAYKSLLLPGIMAISMVFTGVWAVAMPLIAEFQFTREIEDRLLAPIEHFMAGDRESYFRHAASAGRGSGGDSDGVAIAASRGFQSAFAAALRLRHAAGGAFLGLRRPGARLQREPDAHRPDVQHGFDADDFFRLHLLSVERAESFSHPAEKSFSSIRWFMRARACAERSCRSFRISTPL
jgi:hypothetical protein